MTDVRGKVTSDEADVGIVCRTDALAERARIETIDIQGVDQAVNAYPIIVVANTMYSKLAQAWVDLVLSADGQKALSDAGLIAAAVR